MAFQHNNFVSTDRGVHPVAYGRVVLYQWVREGPFVHFVYDVFHDVDSAGGVNGGRPTARAVDRYDFTVRDEPRSVGTGGVIIPAVTPYTDLFHPSKLRLLDNEPVRACYAYLATQPLGIGTVAV